MRTFSREITGPADFELGRPRSAPLSFAATFPEGEAQGLVFLIPGFGGDTDDGYAQALRKHVAANHGMAAVSVRYHCFGSRPGTKGKVEVDPREHLMLLGLALTHKVPLGKLSDTEDVARRLAAAGIKAQARATIKPARGEYQNFGLLQAMDHLAVLGHLIEKGEVFDRRRIVALGSSHGGFIAHMMAKIAPRTLAMVIDNSSYTQPPMEYLGQPASAEFVYALAGEVMAYCRTRSAWSTGNRQAPDFYDRDRDLIRDTHYPAHLAAAKIQAGESSTLYRMVNAAEDGISPPQMKQRQATALSALGFDARLALIGQAELDGQVFKKMVHGLDASLAGFFDLAIPDLQPRDGPIDQEAGSVVAYECIDSIYRFTHGAAAPYVRGEVTSRFFPEPGA